MTDAAKKRTYEYYAMGYSNTIRPTAVQGPYIQPQPAKTFYTLAVTESVFVEGKKTSVRKLIDLPIEGVSTVYKDVTADSVEICGVLGSMQEEHAEIDYSIVLALQDITQALNSLLFSRITLSTMDIQKKRAFLDEFIKKLDGLLMRYDKRLKRKVLRGRSRKSFLRGLSEALNAERVEFVRQEKHGDNFLIARELGTSAHDVRRELSRTYAERAKDPENKEQLKGLTAEQIKKEFEQQDNEYRGFIFSQPDNLEIVAYFAVLRTARRAAARESRQKLTLKTGRFVEVDKCIEFQIYANEILEALHRETAGHRGVTNREAVRKALVRFSTRAYAYYEKKTGKRATLSAGTLFRFSNVALEDDAPADPTDDTSAPVQMITDGAEFQAEPIEPKQRSRGGDKAPPEVWRFIGLSTGKNWFPIDFRKKHYSYHPIPWNVFDYFFSHEKNINTACALCMSAFWIIEDLIIQNEADELRAKDQHTAPPPAIMPLPFSPRRLMLPPNAKNREFREQYIETLKYALKQFYNTDLSIDQNGDIALNRRKMIE